MIVDYWNGKETAIYHIDSRNKKAGTSSNFYYNIHQ